MYTVTDDTGCAKDFTFIIECTVIPSWDCDAQGNCSDPGTGLGQYSSFASCDTACATPVCPVGHDFTVTDIGGCQVKVDVGQSIPISTVGSNWVSWKISINLDATGIGVSSGPQYSSSASPPPFPMTTSGMHTVKLVFTFPNGQTQTCDMVQIDLNCSAPVYEFACVDNLCTNVGSGGTFTTMQDCLNSGCQEDSACNSHGITVVSEITDAPCNSPINTGGYEITLSGFVGGVDNAANISLANPFNVSMLDGSFTGQYHVELLQTHNFLGQPTNNADGSGFFSGYTGNAQSKHMYTTAPNTLQSETFSNTTAVPHNLGPVVGGDYKVNVWFYLNALTTSNPPNQLAPPCQDPNSFGCNQVVLPCEVATFNVPCEQQVINGCTDALASNYNPLANTNDGSCIYGSTAGGCGDAQSSFTITPASGYPFCTTGSVVVNVTNIYLSLGTSTSWRVTLINQQYSQISYTSSTYTTTSQQISFQNQISGSYYSILEFDVGNNQTNSCQFGNFTIPCL